MNTENHYQETDLGNISLNPRGEYSPEESYEYLDMVVFEGGSYVCLAENGTDITGISPESGKTTQYWQVITIPGDLTPEYVAIHDRVINLSEQVGADAEEIRTAEQNVSGMELNVTQMQEQTRQAAESAEQSKDSAAGYAASADASRQAAEESEQNINAQITGFDVHVAEKTEEAENDIEAARIAANKVIIAQQEQSVNEVARAGIEAISTARAAAQTATEKAQAAATSEKNAAESETAAKLSETNATKMAEQVATDKEQVANDRTAVEKAKQEMTESVAQIEQNTQGISELKGDLANSKKSIAELNDKKITRFYASNLGETNLSDSDNGKIQDMMLYGKSIQDGTPTPDNPVEIQSVVNPKLSVCGVNIFDYEKYITSSSYEENGYTVRNYQLEPNTKYYFKNIVRRANGAVGIWLLQPNDSTINGDSFIGLTTNYPLIESFTTKQDGIIKIGFMNVVDENYLKDNLIISTNEIVTSIFVPFKGYQTATLPYTLNAIPVSSGGNVTIDGQQYIADYVDIEKKQLVRHVGDVDLGTLNFEKDGITYRNQLSNFKIVDNSIPIYALCEKYYPVVYNDSWYTTGMMSQDTSKKIIFVNSTLSSVSEFKQSVSGTKLLYALATPTITDLTDEEVQNFKELATYYPTTNVIVTSDQLDGYTTFNYPIGMENGWNLIKEQLGDTREYIYDMELQSAEAYVNSEYAVTLTELGV